MIKTKADLYKEIGNQINKKYRTGKKLSFYGINRLIHNGEEPNISTNYIRRIAKKEGSMPSLEKLMYIAGEMGIEYCFEFRAK